MAEGELTRWYHCQSPPGTPLSAGRRGAGTPGAVSCSELCRNRPGSHSGSPARPRCTPAPAGWGTAWDSSGTPPNKAKCRLYFYIFLKLILKPIFIPWLSTMHEHAWCSCFSVLWFGYFSIYFSNLFVFQCVLFICVQHLVSAVVVLKCFINKVELSSSNEDFAFLCMELWRGHHCDLK